MAATIEPADRTREIQRDIERTRGEMDDTLTALEQRLSPEQLLHRGVGSMRRGFSHLAASAGATVRRHPAPIAAAALLIGLRFALRPGAQQRRRLQAQEDLDRTWALVAAVLERARQRSRVGRGRIEQLARDVAAEPGSYARPAWREAARIGRRGGERLLRVAERTRHEIRDAARTLGGRRDSRGLTTVAALGIAVGAACVGASRFRRG